MSDHILAIDVGTQSIRALLFNLQGHLVHKVRIPIEPYISPQPGWAEQDPDYFWENLCAACRRLWQESPVPKDAVAGVALTAQRATMVNVGRDGRPLRPAIVWLDAPHGRAEAHRWTLGPGLPLGRPHRHRRLPAGGSGSELGFRTFQPEIWRNTHKYLFLSGYLTYRLVGRFVDSVGCQVGYIPFDYKRLTWARKWDWKWQVVPMDERMLPDLIPPAQELGRITPRPPKRRASRRGCPSSPPLPTKPARSWGRGPGAGGRLSLLRHDGNGQHHQSPLRGGHPSHPTLSQRVPGAYNLEVQVYRGYWMVSWFRQEFGLREEQIARERGCAPEDLFDELVEAVPPGPWA